MIGSASVTIVLAYLESEDDLRDSDDARVEFAKYALDHLRFMFKKTKGEVEVRVQLYTSFSTLTSSYRISEASSLACWCFKHLQRTSLLLAVPARLQA